MTGSASSCDAGTGLRKKPERRLRRTQSQVNAGAYVQSSTLTVEQACAEWLRSRHKTRPTTAAGYEYELQPVRGELGDLAVQDLTRRHVDDPEGA